MSSNGAMAMSKQLKEIKFIARLCLLLQIYYGTKAHKRNKTS